ncbi:m18 family aminopeptidase 1-related [Anaeramoeba ignava]|uniref:M18 family aminopeptidase 1-related n=1 Tax=Anaeramoeba ignava TaxID=1746090 RepID=A0A9Q0LUV7_ANAIG|nr:m18 family aminopeptidase 1-related [Anaeramoeba ignava]
MEKNQEITEKDLKSKLFWEKKNGYEEIDEKSLNEIFEFAEEFKKFLDSSKTERECINTIEEISEKSGFVEISKASKTDKNIFCQFDRVCGALIYLKDPQKLEDGFLIVGSHIDSPRLDLKQMPIYETLDMGYAKTHYYGGIKKYQWVTRPLALHGVVILQTGEVKKIVIGENLNDPVFTINDLLPHLAANQMEKKGNKVIEGENLNILIGSIPLNLKKDTNSIKLNILNILHEKYGIVEEDFISSELQLVPAGLSRDVGLDRSFVGGYGQDDRVCSFCGMKAFLDLTLNHQDLISKNIMMLFFDKEEIGSQGNSGANSNLVKRIFSQILEIHGKKEYNSLLQTLTNSQLLSADVEGGIEPEWKNLWEERNGSKIGYGVSLSKYTGSRGKSGCNEAHAEFVSRIRKVFNENGVHYQPSELGKIDQGGGGTISKYLANLGMQVCDCGTPILSMHSPFEVSSKADIFHTFKAFQAFFQMK